jgi:hypothetical protein
LLGERSRTYEIAKHHGELPTFTVGRHMLGGTWFRLSTLDFGPQP